MKNYKYSIALTVTCLTLLINACQSPKSTKKSTSLGNIDFKVTGSPEAVDTFEKGVLLLHSFMYSDTADEFKKAQEIDPEFAMAYWGESMSLAPDSGHALHMPSHIYIKKRLS